MTEQNPETRLYDRLSVAGYRVLPISNTPFLDAFTKQLNGQITQAQVFDIQNVTDYFYIHGGRQETGWDYRDFPNIAPPYQDYFMEFRFKNNWVKENKNNIRAVGVHSHFEEVANIKPLPRTISRIEDGRWMGVHTMFLELDKFDILAYSQAIIGVHEDGSMVKDPGTNHWVFGRLMDDFIDDRRLTPEASKKIQAANVGFLYPALFATSFLHCKNVTVATEEPSLKMSKVFQKKRGKPLVTFHTLELEPMREVIKREGQIEKLGLRRALHQVRAHFATYEEAAPLFGKVTGTFWIPQHRRGSIQEGLALKDYNIKIS